MVDSTLTTNNKRSRAFSLLEMLVSLAILAVIIPLLSNLLVDTIRSSLLLSARSSTREELSSLVALVRSDIRNADEIVNCGEIGNPASQLSCELIVEGNVVRWQACDSDPLVMCKLDATNQELLNSSANFKLESVRFEPGFGDSSIATQRSIIVTVVGSHQNTDLDINNLVVQTTVSTRNYNLDDIV